jgi:hypothetical protein
LEELYNFLVAFCTQYSKEVDLLEQPLWIDRILDDQHNMQEKNHQVQHMDKSFGCAREAFAWFGLDNDIVEFFESERLRTEITSYDENLWSVCI